MNWLYTNIDLTHGLIDFGSISKHEVKGELSNYVICIFLYMLSSKSWSGRTSIQVLGYLINVISILILTVKSGYMVVKLMKLLLNLTK